MDATALLIEATLLASKSSDFSEENDKDGVQMYKLPPTDGLIRALYAAAFSRFVTGFCDSRQTSNHKQTMYEVAATIGMPVAFVDLRHECAHADPPSRRRLERSVGQALDWMWEIYWSRLSGNGEDDLTSNECDECGLRDSDDNKASYGAAEHENVENVLEKQRVQDSLRAILKNYLATRKDVIFRKRENGSNEVNIARSEESSVRATYKELTQICERKATRFGLLQTVLLEIKIMLPSTDATSETMKTAFDLWDSLLQYIAQRQPLFLLGLARTMLAALNKISVFPSNSPPDNFSTSTAASTAALYAWLSHILTSKVWLEFLRVSDRSNSNESQTRLYQQIISECLLTPTPLTVRLAHDIVSSSDLPSSLRRDWAPAVNACLPLVEDWWDRTGGSGGPDRISGNDTGHHERLEVLDALPLIDVFPLDDKDKDKDDDDLELPQNSSSSNDGESNSKNHTNEMAVPHDGARQVDSDDECRDLAMHGWKIWTGKWTPTPIGVVAS